MLCGDKRLKGLPLSLIQAGSGLRNKQFVEYLKNYESRLFDDASDDLIVEYFDTLADTLVRYVNQMKDVLSIKVLEDIERIQEKDVVKPSLA